MSCRIEEETQCSYPVEIYFDRRIVGGTTNLTQVAAVGMDNTNRNFFVWVNGADRMNIDLSGNVGIGTNTPQWPLHITRSVGTTSTFSGYSITWLKNSSASANTSSADGYGIVVEASTTTTKSGVKAGFFFAASGTLAPSDRRIKNDMRDISDGEALEALRKIEPNRYRYIDRISRPNEEVFGFIAQQVAEHFPQAVSRMTEFIPNIFSAKPLTYRTEGTTTYCTIQDISEDVVTTCVSGQILRIFDISDIKYDLPIYSIDSSSSLTVVMPAQMTVFNAGSDMENRTFIFGVEVKDFNALNKDYLFTINFAATQELDRQVQALTARNAELQRKLDAVIQHLGITI
jgi:hypothetical protein